MSFNGNYTQEDPFTAKRHHDTPFFVVWNEGDIRKITDYLQANGGVRFTGVEWGSDKLGNPLCRVSVSDGKQPAGRFPDRVCTIVCRKPNMKECVDSALKARMAQ